MSLQKLSSNKPSRAVSKQALVLATAPWWPSLFLRSALAWGVGEIAGYRHSQDLTPLELNIPLVFK